jgi:hypothetical protein
MVANILYQHLFCHVVGYYNDHKRTFIPQFFFQYCFLKKYFLHLQHVIVVVVVIIAVVVDRLFNMTQNGILQWRDQDWAGKLGGLAF